MPGKQNKTQEWKHVSFRLARDSFDVLSAYASAHGLDLTALLNWLVAERCPELARRVQERKAVLEAAGRPAA